jgi:hypothetical protein
VRAFDEAGQRGARVAGRPELLELHAAAARLEQAQHHALAVQRGERAHAHVDLAPLEAQPHAPVLRQAALGDVELGHDLEAAHHRGPQVRRRRRRFLEHAVDAVAHVQPLPRGLEVDVARPGGERLGEQQVHEPDHRRLVGQLLEVVRHELVGARAARVGAVAEAGDEPGRGGRLVVAVRVAHGGQQLVLGSSCSSSGAAKSPVSSARACGSGVPAWATTTRSPTRVSGRRRCSSRYSAESRSLMRRGARRPSTRPSGAGIAALIGRTPAAPPAGGRCR